MFGIAVNTTAIYLLKDYIKLDLSHVLLGTLIGSQFPDLDSDRSWITQTIPFPYKILKHTKKLYYKTHRTVLLHSIYTIIMSIALMIMFKNSLIIGFGLGIISHILTDSCIKCDSLGEKICYYISCVIIIFNCIKEVFR